MDANAASIFLYARVSSDQQQSHLVIDQTATPRAMRSHRTARPHSRILHAPHIASSAYSWSEITNVADIIRRLPAISNRILKGARPADIATERVAHLARPRPILRISTGSSLEPSSSSTSCCEW